MEDAQKTLDSQNPVRRRTTDTGSDTPDLPTTSKFKVPLSSKASGRLDVPSPLGKSIPSPNLSDDEALSNASSDSFDWIGDDREKEREFAESFGEDTEGTGFPNDENVAVRDMFLPNLVNNLLLGHLLLCSTIWMSCRMLLGETPAFAQISLDTWALFAMILVFAPIWADVGLKKLSKYLQANTFLSKTDHPARIATVAVPLSISIGAFISGAFWITHFPASCINDPTIEISAQDATITQGFCGYDHVPRLLLFCIAAGLVMSVGSVIMMVVKNSFQETSFKKRIVENQFKVYVVDQLLMAANQERSTRRAEKQKEPKGSTGYSRFIFNLPFIIPEFIFHWCHKITVAAARRASSSEGAATDYSEFRSKILRAIQKDGCESVTNSRPRTDYDAKVMARMAFHYLCPAGRSYLTMADFSTIIDNKDACRDAYNVFDVDGDGTITKSEFKGALVRIFREQRNLAQNVANTGSALSILNTIGKVVSTAGLFLLLLAIMGVKVQNILGFSASFIFAMNFIIMDSANKTFSSLLFLFVVHPYDIGDRVLIGKEAGHSDEEILTVLHINIQNTVFKRWNGLLVTMPNHVLAVGPLTNLSRGGEQWERVEFSILAPDHSRLSVDEETEKLADLRRQIEAFLISNNKDYYQSFELRAVVAADYGAADKNFDALKFILKIRCKDTVDSQRKWTRHARILAFVKQVVPSAGVKFSA